MNANQRSRAEYIMQRAQQWAEDNWRTPWRLLMSIRTSKAVFFRAAIINALRAEGLTLPEIGGYLDRHHASIVNALHNMDVYKMDAEYQRIAAGVKEYLSTEDITTINQNNQIMFNATICGNLARDCESRQINGKEYTCFSVAVESGKDSTTWVRVNYYGTGKVRELLRKGAKVLCTGRLAIGVYESKPDVTLWADNVEIVKYADNGKAAAQPSGKGEDGDGDLPW